MRFVRFSRESSASAAARRRWASRRDASAPALRAHLRALLAARRTRKGRLAAALSHHEAKIADYFAAGFSKSFGSTVGLISIVVTLPLPLGWPLVVVVKATGSVMPSKVFHSV